MASFENPRFLVATSNQGKVQELAALLADTPWTLVSPADVGVVLSVEETGRTFVENARLKARAYFEAADMPTVAEDSGLEIDALAGEPGVLSARYHRLPDGSTKNAHILELLADVPLGRRGCRYVCALVLVEPDGSEHVFGGTCAGRIGLAPTGQGGFGFDPIVFIPRLGRTMAELTLAEKNRISHRGRAARKLSAYLRRRESRAEGERRSGY
ncbi:MAG: RdgB/HAM1 family non-canonical purine NTP pyrophosphatase [Chloroflexi bacterium]|nr:RdgB/HAM1 family non-canonical purine NTP pyrophosphatase [Chloroflexota bacterium]